MARSTLPDLDYGDEVAGCKWIGTFKGGKSGGETWWKLQ